jgi:hypothetical protein
MAMAIDTIYQLLVLQYFYPLQALIVSCVLAIIPYAIVRGPAARVAKLSSKRMS